MSSSKGVGIPVKLLHEAEGHVITVSRLGRLYDGCRGSSQARARGSLKGVCCSQVELKSGEMYRGELVEAEDSWNVQLKNVTATSKVQTSSILVAILLLTPSFEL